MRKFGSDFCFSYEGYATITPHVDIAGPPVGATAVFKSLSPISIFGFSWTRLPVWSIFSSDTFADILT